MKEINHTAMQRSQTAVTTSLELVTHGIYIQCLTLSTAWYCHSVYILVLATLDCCVHVCSHSDFPGAGPIYWKCLNPIT